MEKNITREIKVYKYTFGHVDTATLSASDTVVFTTSAKLSARKVNQKSKELGGRVFLKCEEETHKYSMPLDLFIGACQEYAKSVHEQAFLDPVVDDDSTDTDNTEN